jgi:hypothetical protein
MQRTSGKNAQVFLQRGGDAPVDISGAAPDRRGRANTWSFQSTPSIVETGGYGQHHQEPVSTQQTSSTLALTLWWSSVAGEPPAMLRQMHQEQHQQDACATPTVYVVDMYPAGVCDGFLWRLTQAIVGVRSWVTPPDNVITMDVEISGFEARQGYAEPLTLSSVVTLASGENLECSDDGTNQATILAAMREYFAGLLPGDAYSQSDLDAAIAAASNVTSSTTSVTSGDTTQDGTTLFTFGTATLVQTVPVDTNLTIVYDSGSTFSTVQANVVTAVQNYINGLAQGADVLRSGIIAAAEGVAGVTSVTLHSPATDVTMAACQQAEAGSVVVNDGGPYGSGVTEVSVNVTVQYTNTFVQGNSEDFDACVWSTVFAWFDTLGPGDDVDPAALLSELHFSCDYLIEYPEEMYLIDPGVTVVIGPDEQAVAGIVDVISGT